MVLIVREKKTVCLCWCLFSGFWLKVLQMTGSHHCMVQFLRVASCANRDVFLMVLFVRERTGLLMLAFNGGAC